MQRALLAGGGLVIGVLAVLGAAALFGDDGPDGRAPVTSFPAVDHDPAAAEALVEAWQRWRTATFVTVGTWSRALDDAESVLEGPTYMAQDPPRRLSLRLGAVIEEFDATVARCDLPSEELIVPDCLAATTSRTYDDRVADEMAVVVEYVSGDARVYDIGFGAEGCWQAELEVPLLRVPWGRWSEFCFDAETGALRSSRIRRQSAVDTEITLDVRAEVTDADFAVGS